MISSDSNKSTIRLKDLYNESISSRDAVSLLFDRPFESKEIIEVDFSGIEFITRSATHQLLKEIQRVQEQFKAVVLITSPNEEVKKMIKIVRESIANPAKKKSEVKQVALRNYAELEEFLSHF